ncbi:hypothetical protein LCGC14_1406400, partial [marine sediment metagenome]
MPKPSNIDGAALSNIFRGQQESDTITDPDNPPAINIAYLFSPDPRAQRLELYKKLREIELSERVRNEEIISAVEILRILYPNGYSGFSDPVLGLGAWGSERGLDTRYLSFWGGLNKDINEDKKDKIKANIKNSEKFKGFFLSELSKLKDLYTFTDLQLIDDRVRELNGEKYRGYYA